MRNEKSQSVMHGGIINCFYQVHLKSHEIRNLDFRFEACKNNERVINQSAWVG